MRTTVDIGDELFRRAKKRAADEGVPLRSILEEALRRYLSDRSTTGTYKLRWRAERGQLAPGVDLDDRDALFDFMEGKRK